MDKVHSTQFDLVLMDVQMPEMDGIEATRNIHANERFKDLPVIALTANIFEADRKACEEAGMVDFVAKPVDPHTSTECSQSGCRREHHLTPGRPLLLSP